MAVIKFSDILASSIHDIKNALSMVTGSLEQLACDPELGLARNPRILRLQLETQRVNHDLIQLLALYRYENEKLSANLTAHNLEEFIEEVAIENRTLSEAREIRIDTRCDPELDGYFDEQLVRVVINNALNNAQRHTRDRILLSADETQGYLRICIEDNGDGFPEALLARQTASGSAPRIDQGRTHLGLHFSSLIARLHTDRGRQGFIRLENHVNLSGACVSLWLP
ncbi:MAG: HAMP domain-containing sensor histidine kinase [Chromatiales bacterium]|jgi:signal transduction histidine kinase